MDSPLDGVEYSVHLLVSRRSATVKPQSAAVAFSEHAVQHQGMDVDVHIERRPEPLDDRHGPAASVSDALFPRPSSEEAEHRADQDRHHRPAQRVIPGEQIPNPVR